MKVEEYFKPEVVITATQHYRRYVTDLFKTMPTEAETLLHAAVGIVGEVAELSERFTQIVQQNEDADIPEFSQDLNVQEELSDMGFYILAGAVHLNISDAELEETDVVTHFEDPFGTQGMLIYPGRLLDLVKKCWVYGKPVDDLRDDIRAELFQVWQAYKRVLYRLDLSMDWIRMVNVTKLSQRYPLGKYTDGHALARLDKAEGEAAFKEAVESQTNAEFAFRARVLSALYSYDSILHDINRGAVTEPKTDDAYQRLSKWLRGESSYKNDDADSLKDLETLNAWGAI